MNLQDKAWRARVGFDNIMNEEDLRREASLDNTVLGGRSHNERIVRSPSPERPSPSRRPSEGTGQFNGSMN